MARFVDIYTLLFLFLKIFKELEYFHLLSPSGKGGGPLEAV